MSSQDVNYWPEIRGRTVAIKYLLSHAGVEIKNNQDAPNLDLFKTGMGSWAPYKIQMLKDYPLINLPFINYEFQDESGQDQKLKISQAYTILRVLAEKHGYTPKNAIDRIRAEEMYEHLRDIEMKIALMITMIDPTLPDTKAKVKFALHQKVPEMLKVVEASMKFYNHEYVGWSQPTFNDFILLGLMDLLIKMKPNLMDNLPVLKQWHEKILSHDGVKKMHDELDPLPITMNYKKWFEDMPEEGKRQMIATMGKEKVDFMIQSLPNQNWGYKGHDMGPIPE